VPVPLPIRSTRRTLLGAGLLALGGCTLDRDPESPTASGTPQLTDQEYDERLVDQVSTSTTAALAFIEQASARFDQVTVALSALVGLHEAHLSALSIVTPPPVTPVPVPAQQGSAMARLRSLEQDLQAELAAASGNARSGQLARVLAGMSAGVAQQVVLLSRKQVAR